MTSTLTKSENLLTAPPEGTSTLLRIEPSKGWVSLKLGELWAYRELLYFLTWRDIKVRYKQTTLGAAWAILQPFFTMVVFTVFFGRLAGIEKMVDLIPYPIFSFAGLLPWMFFANGLTHSTNSLVGSANLIKKVYFPRLAIPISSTLSGVVDFAISFAVLLAMMAYYRVAPTFNILFLPFFLLLALIASLGVGLWLTALNVKYRDIRYTVPFLIQFWMFATPVIYPSKVIQNPVWHTLYSLNPMVGVVEGFRWAMLGWGQRPGPMVLASAVSALLVLLTGAYYFRRMEKQFADIV
jgi:lipopolysaccharide transport system permease protein